MSTEVVEDQTAGEDPVSPVPQERKRADSRSAEPASPEIHFEPIVTLPIVDVSTLEEDEKELFKIRAKLYRYDTTEDTPEFKERGTGDVKLLKHRESGQIRILMRRDKTLKICANHYIVPRMELKKHNNSDKVFVWSTLSDYVDDSPKPETLAIRFGSVENAQKFKEAFESAKKEMSEKQNDLSGIEDQLEKTNLSDDDDEDEDEDEDESSDVHF